MKKKDKMHDFGALGKWSESTLEEHKESIFGDTCYDWQKYVIVHIERTYNDKNTELIPSVHFAFNKNIKSMVVGELMQAINDYKELKNKNDVLTCCYDKYEKLMLKFAKRDKLIGAINQ